MTESDPQLEEFAGKLFDMARQGDVTLIEYIKQGVNPNLVNQNGESFLMLASYNGHVELTRALIEVGADVDLLNDRKQSPLGGVIFKKEEQLIEVLLEAGADPHAGSPSALDIAQMFERPDLVERFS
ncbi:ankyrin repeat containing protein [Corynebacterium camporealensis]|uniref:Ankyrin repeats (3 copies) n=1 Tax=Corynebacterium camporealensis TaxID=161896 RepID=A0A0F6QZ84_9CORY|nr:ankyrin repeat domain-containing protein [Corynebacterium camporealensis]AKE39693.1 Ankyrin repeats (3 copies) [Corynebacterium camporealensis]AVH88819.1 ankyrin repeat containing protein [Corynebacterium camporealensis]